MNPQSIWGALAEAPLLPLVQQRAVAESMTLRGAPDAVARFFARPDLEDDVRHQLVRRVHDRQVLKAMLVTPVVTAAHLLTAADRLGAEMVLLDIVRSRYDLRDAAVSLIERLDHGAARRVAESWEFMSPEIRAALIRAATCSRPAAMDTDVDHRDDAEIERLRAAVQVWHDDIWTLLSAEPARRLWPELVGDEECGGLIGSLLLNRAEDLDDLVLLACLEARYPADGKDPEAIDIDGALGAYVRLSALARVVTRHRRAPLLHGQVLRRLIAAEVAQLTDGMREEGASDTDWKGFAVLAVVCTVPEVLRAAADCLAQATVSSWHRWRQPSRAWTVARSEAADALARNPLCDEDTLAVLAPFLGAETAVQFLEHSDERVRDAVAVTVEQERDRIRRTPASLSTARKKANPPRVPADGELASEADPGAALSAFLPLKGSAAHRRDTALAILGSRFADASHLRHIPAVLVLSSTAQAPAAAALLQADLGDCAEAWEAFSGVVNRLAPNATKTLGTLIEEALAEGR